MANDIYVHEVGFNLHLTRQIQTTFEDVGHIYFQLPSYSPFLHALEWVHGQYQRPCLTE